MRVENASAHPLCPPCILYCHVRVRLQSLSLDRPPFQHDFVHVRNSREEVVAWRVFLIFSWGVFSRVNVNIKMLYKMTHLIGLFNLIYPVRVFVQNERK